MRWTNGPEWPVVLAVAMLGLAGLAHSGDVEDTVIRLEKEWGAATLEHNVAAVSRILSDDFVGVDGRGLISDKAGELREVEADNPDFQFVSESLDELKVRVYGDTAVLNARNTAQVRSRGEERTIRFRRTTVWVRREGRWQCVSFHASRILEPPTR